MNKLKQILYEFRLKNVDRKLTRNAEKMREHLNGSYTLNEDFFETNHIHLEQLRLMSCRSYLENKLTYVKN
jgi:hypothetical protein